MAAYHSCQFAYLDATFKCIVSDSSCSWVEWEYMYHTPFLPNPSRIASKQTRQAYFVESTSMAAAVPKQRHEYEDAISVVSEPVPLNNPAPSTWCCPPEGVMRVSFGGAFGSSSWQGGTGIVMRDSSGFVIEAAGAWYPFAADSSVMEAYALRDAVCLAITLDLRRVWFEGDARAIIDAMKTSQFQDSEVDLVLEEAAGLLLEHFDECKFLYVQPDCNWAAHHLAQKGLHEKISPFIVIPFDRWFRSLMEEEEAHQTL